ncbi:MAG TPA: glycosyltransferase family 4 protein [Rhodanobacteraceae bacterium]
MKTRPNHDATRVLMLGWEYPPRFVGGLGKASQGLAHGLADLGLDVVFVLPQFDSRRDGRRLRVIGAHNWNVHHHGSIIPRQAGGRHLLPLAARLSPYANPDPTTPGADLPVGDPRRIYGSELGREVRRFATQAGAIARCAQADVVHAHDWMTFPAAMAIAQREHLPWFVHVHSTEYDRAGSGANPDVAAIEQAACQQATGVFAVSDYTRRIIIERYGVPPERVRVIYNAPDGPIRAAASQPIDRREPWIVFVGRLTFQKGPDHFLRAAADVARWHPQARFILCGTGDMRGRLEQQSHELGIADRVEFRGFVAPRQIDKLLARSSLLVMPSVSEPFGLVALEALRAGTPIIVSRQSGVREVISHSLQADFWDTDKLADQMLAVLRLPTLACQLVDEGRSQLAMLSWHASALGIIEAYARAGIRVPDELGHIGAEATS